MTTRDTLKTLIDQLPDEKLAHVEMMLNHQVNPPQLPTELVRRREQMQTAGEGYRERVMVYLLELRCSIKCLCLQETTMVLHSKAVSAAAMRLVLMRLFKSGDRISSFVA
jgi:hypothetical protein